MDRSVRQTIPVTRSRGRSSPRSSSVSYDMRPVARVEAQDLIEAEREYQRQQELEKCASDLAMEAMEYKFLSRRKRLMTRKLMRCGRDTSDPELSARAQSGATRLDGNGNVIDGSSGPPVVAVPAQHQRLVGAQSPVAPDLELLANTRANDSELLVVTGADREPRPEQSVRSKHERELSSDSPMARLYRRRLFEGSEDNPDFFPMARRTVTNRSTQTDHWPRSDVAVNTEIDFRFDLFCP